MAETLLWIGKAVLTILSLGQRGVRCEVAKRRPTYPFAHPADSDYFHFTRAFAILDASLDRSERVGNVLLDRLVDLYKSVVEENDHLFDLCLEHA